ERRGGGRADRDGQHGSRARAGRPTVGRPDRAFAVELPDRRRALPLHATADPRARGAEEGRRPGERRARHAAAREGGAHHARRRRGDLRGARRPLPARGVPDRVRHADEHERERGDLEPRHPARGRRARDEAAGPPERRRQQGTVLERHFPDRHAHRGRGGDRGGPDPGRHPSARHAAREERDLRGRGQDRPHPPAGRHAAHPGPGDRRLGGAARLLPARGAPRAARALRPGDRRHRGRDRPERPSPLRRPGRRQDGGGDGTTVPLGGEQVRGPRRPRRARRGERVPADAGRGADEDRERRALARLRAPLRHRRDRDPRERARLVDHAGQGQPHAVRGADHGRRAGVRQRRRRGVRRLAGQLRAERLQAGHGPQRARVDRAARGRLPGLRRALRGRHRAEPGADRAQPERVADAGHGAQPAHRLREGRRDREEGARGWHDPAGGGRGARTRDGRAVRRVGAPRGDDGAPRL
ncbi:MAG: Fumarate hydratase class II, partial [uncultured Thermoleophilia bacterium]